MKTINLARMASVLFISALIISILSACGNQDNNTADATETQISGGENIPADETADTAADRYDDELGKHDFNGEEFKIQTWENVNINNHIDTEEETGDIFNDALYRRNRTIEERFNVIIKQVLVPDFSRARTKSTILAGDYTAFDLIIERAPDGLLNWQEDLALSYDDINYIDLSKPYWNQSANKTLTLAENQYVAIGDFNFSTYEMCHAVLFNKGMVKDFGLDDPYQLVNEGKWTFDKMEEMMKSVIADLNGDGIMDENDRYGYVAHPKEVLPSFWIGADVFTVGKDNKDIPYLSMGEEKYINAFNKTFEILWDSGAYYMGGGGDMVPEWAIRMFSNNQSLFMDTTFFAIELLRSTETDFGILPYPKYDETQRNYVSRIEYYMANQVPVINRDPDRAGIMLEALHSESAKTIMPAYHEIALKTKYARDDESARMLEIIMGNLVVDIGDTTLCDKIRDGFLAGMFERNNRDLVSRLERTEIIIDQFIDNIPR